jgi:hypothetical protein
VTTEQHDMTAAQKDWAVFLPALSSFYATFIGRQRSEQFVAAARMPPGIPDMEQLNWLNPQQGLFPYRWSLYSAGHARLDLSQHYPREDMVRNRDPGSLLVADSGGFQIAKGVWPGRWTEANNVEAQRRRRDVLEWQCAIADWGMTMDVPTWTFRDPVAAEAANIRSYQDAVDASQINIDYWMNNRHGKMRVLNVLQGGNHGEADHWYELMKGYSDPGKHQRPFEGWGMGGQNMCDVHLILRRIITLIYDGLLEPGLHEWMHFLGTSKLEWAVLLTHIQRAVRYHHNPNFTISFDCASPFLATANGQLYYTINTPHRGKWSYLMQSTADDRRYSSDSRAWGPGVTQDGIHRTFRESPISQRCRMQDICVYQPGQTNKNNKVSRTSWDSFSYCLLMAHNVWTHIEAVQQANREWDQGRAPAMLLHQRDTWYDFARVVDRVFAARDRQKSLAIIDEHANIWQQIIGTRGFTGDRAVNSQVMFNQLFDVGDKPDANPDELDQSLLDQLEEEDQDV